MLDSIWNLKLKLNTFKKIMYKHAFTKKKQLYILSIVTLQYILLDSLNRCPR